MPETLSSPTILNGRYQIERELGRRGVATIYAGRDVATGHVVAIRLVRGDAATLGGDRFLNQAKLGAQLHHPNILSVVDSGYVRGPSGSEGAYSVSPYLEGGDLRQRLARDRHLSLEDVLRIVGGVAAALDFAHRQSIVHGNIRPESILLANGEPILTDFGVSAMSPQELLRTMSSEAEVMGALGYMSPEQLAGGPLSERSDQYSLAAVAYEMLTGEPPFTGPTVQTVATTILSEPPRRLTALRVVPRIVERAIERALSKAPAARFRTVAEFAAALHGATNAPPTAAATPTPARPRRRWRAPLVAVVVVLATAVGVAMASRAVVSRQTSTAAAHSQLTFSGIATSPALSPDGRSVLYVAGGRSLLRQPLDGGDATPLLPPASSIAAARWTGDGRAIVVAMTRDSMERPATFLVPAGCPAKAGGCGPARKVLDDARPFDTGADSTVIVRAPREPGRLEIVSLASGKPVRTIPLPDSIGPIGEIAWSPDRRWIAFVDASNAQLWVVGAAGGSPSHLADNARRIRWGADSDALYFLSGPAGAVDLMRVGVDAGSGRAATDAARVTSLLAADAFDVGRNNRLVHTQITPGAQALTFVLDGSGSALRRAITQHPLIEGAARLDGAVVSPDGRWVAYSAAQGAERAVHVMAFGGGSARVLTTSRARDEAPAWSPDGTRLTFAREDSAGRRLVAADALTGAAQRIGSVAGPAVAGTATAARWSASGRHIAYYAQDRKRIALINLQRRNESVVHVPDYVGRPYFAVLPSPNGTQLLATMVDSTEEGPLLWLVFGNGRRWRQIRGSFGEMLPVAWHRNSWIYLVRSRRVATDHGAEHVELWRMRGPTGRAELYAALPEGCGMSVSISADATRGVCNYVRVESDLYVASSFGASSR